MRNKIFVNPNIDVAEVDGEKVMMNMNLGKYFGLNSIGSTIWDIIQKPVTTDDIVSQLLEKYDVTQDICKSQVEQFIKTLEKHQLVTVK
ncbi:MAG: lasso peptide biosynthesis PqqD family chaperone [Clostridium sp.]